MNHLDNPAGRLFLILQKAKKINDQVKTKEAWAEIFGVENENRAEILRKLGEVNQIPATIREKIYSLDNVNHELALKRLGKVETALSKINFNAIWKNFKDAIDEATMLSIEYCSDILSRNFKKKVLEKNDLENVQKRVQEFKKELSEIEIDLELHRFIYEKLSEIERAIFDYELTGSAAIKKEVESALGSSFLNTELLKRDEKMTKKFFEFIGYVSSIVHLTEYGPLLKEQITLLIGQ